MKDLLERACVDDVQGAPVLSLLVLLEDLLVCAAQVHTAPVHAGAPPAPSGAPILVRIVHALGANVTGSPFGDQAESVAGYEAKPPDSMSALSVGHGRVEAGPPTPKNPKSEAFLLIVLLIFVSRHSLFLPH